MVTNISTTNTVNSNVGAHETMAHAGQTGGGNWLQQAGSWLGSDSMSQGMGGMGGMSNGEMILAADQTGGQIFGMLAGQNETTAGNIIKSIPGLSTVGNLVNAAFGSHINEGFVKQTEFGINSAGSQAFNSNTNADVLNDWKNLVQLSHVNKSDVGSDGWFSKKAKRKTNALNEAIDEANALQLTNFGHAVDNADQNTDLRIAQGMIAAYGGPINSFRKYYNDGGNLFNTPQFFTFEPQIHDDGGYLSKAKALIRQNEGWRAKPYKDAPKGKAWRSVGYGFNDSGFREKYPEGISKHYEHGITKEQAEQELEYYLRKSEKTLKNIYGKQWNSFTDNQKAAILDTYYQSPASVGKKSRFYKAVTAGEDAGKYLGVAGYSKRNNIRQGVFGGGAVPKSSGASYSSGYSNVDMASSSGAGQIDTGELPYPSPILEGRSPVVDFDLSGIEPTKVIDPKINLSRPTMDLNFMSSPVAQAPQPQAPTVGTVEDFLASYGDIDDSMLFAHGGFLGRQYDGEGGISNYLVRPQSSRITPIAETLSNEPIYMGPIGEVVVTAKRPQRAAQPKKQEASDFVKSLEANTTPEFKGGFPITEEQVQTPYATSRMRTKVYSPLTMDDTLMNNEYINSPQFKEDLRGQLSSMDKGEVMELQSSLARRGYYDLNPDNMTENEVKAIQTKLYNKGLLKGTKEKAVDGKFGNKTREAWRQYNIDGAVGDRTLDAYFKSASPASRWAKDVPTENTEWCAQWVIKKVRDASGDNFGVTGDAWRMPQNIVNAGGEMLYNIYDKGFKNIKDEGDLKRRTVKAINDHPFDVSQLQIGDVVGIYMPSSNMHEVAMNEGSTYNTHVGVVTGIDKDGMPIIEHNIHKSHHKDRANHLTGSKTGSPRIATVTRPAYSSMNVYTMNTGQSASPYTAEGDNPLFKEYANSVAGAKKEVGKLFPNADMNEVEQAVLAVQGRETNFMNTRGSTLTGMGKVKQKARGFYRDVVKGTDPEDVSSDLSKMKLSTFSPNERQLLGLEKPSDLNNPELAGRAATYLMAKNYDYFKRLAKEYPELGLTKNDLRYLTELSYNQGMGKLKSIGFDDKGNLKLSEIEQIRQMAKPDAKVKDITSTNYRHLGAIGKFFYDRFGEAHTPYISAAESYREKLLSKNKTTGKTLAQAKAYGGNLFPDGGWMDFFKSWNQSQGGNNYFNMDNNWKPSDGLQRNTSNGSVQDWIGVAQTVGNTIANWGEEDSSLGRGGGYSMFGMAAYDLLKGIRNATKSKRESIDQKLGIPIYACGGRLYPDGGALGGMGAGGGESVGAMGYAQAGTAALKLASNAVHQAKLTVDEDKIDRSINRYGYGFDEYASRVNTNGDLLDLWQTNATVNPNLTARDFRDKSEFDDFLNSYAASWEGFNAGQNWGPWGAAIGAVVGGISSRIGSQIGKNKAKHAAEEANEEIERANERRQATLEYLAERVDHENDLRILQDMDKRNINSGASGGDLNMGFGLRNPFIMPDGVANPLYRSFGGGLTHGVNWDTGVNWVDEGGSHGENPLGGVPMGVDDQGIPNLVEEGEAIWNGDYVFSKRMKVPKKLAKKYGLGGDITFADAIKKLTKDSEERPLSMIDRDTNDHILGEFADVQEERRMAKAQRAMEREQQLQEDFMTGFQYGLGGHLSPFGIVPNSDNISPFEKAEQKFANGGGIHIDPSKRGTFKAQASRMGMGVQEAASHILANKENYSPAMVKKANFVKVFAHADGGDLFTNPFAYGGEMGNMFDGTGDRPNTLYVSTQSPARRMFGDSVGSFFENVADVANDPIGYFAGDEIDAAMKKVAKMSKPQLEKFFKTSLGQRVAQYIVESENGNSRNYTEAGKGRGVMRAAQRAYRPVQREVAAAARRAYQQARTAARSQGKAPAASRASQASRASAPTPTTAQQAYRQAANRDLQRGTQWAENARRATPRPNVTTGRGATPNPYAGLEGTLQFGSTTPWGTIGAVGGGTAALGTAAAIAAASDNGRGAANTRRAAAPARTNTGLSAQLDARLDAMDNAPWMDMSAITGPSYLSPAELQAMGQQQAAQAAAAQAASNRGRRNRAASTTSTTRGSAGNVARTAAPVVGETGLNLYDWYRNGSDGISEPTGFTVGENGLIDRKTGYTQGYRDLVGKRTADDIRKWAEARGWKPGMTDFSTITDPSLRSFLEKGNKLEQLTTDQWRTGALDGKYGFMHHVADSMLNEKAPAKKAASVAPAGVSEVEIPQQELLAVDPRIAEDPARIAKGTRTTTVDENGTKVTRITDPDAEVKGNTGNGKFKPRPTWMRQVPIWMSGLAALRGELTPPDYTNADAILSAAYAAGRPVSVGTEYVGDYRRRDPFDERYLMNIINQNAAATRENLMNFSGGNRAVAMSGMSNNDLTRQMALAEAARQAYLANRADDAQVSDFNYRTNKGNADAQNTRNLALAQLNSGRQNAMLSGVAQGARLRQAIKDQRDAAISANWTAFAQNMGDWGKENGYYNMLGGLNEEGVLKYFFGDDWKTKFNNNSMG